MNDNNNVYFIKFSMKFINLEKVKEEKLDLCRSMANILETSVLIFLFFLISSFLSDSFTHMYTYTHKHMHTRTHKV